MYLRAWLGLLALAALVLSPACGPRSHTLDPTQVLATTALPAPPQALSAAANTATAQTAKHVVLATATAGAVPGASPQPAVSIMPAPTASSQATAAPPTAMVVASIAPSRTPPPSASAGPSPTPMGVATSTALRPCQDPTAGYETQLADLVAFVRDQGLPSRVAQVDLATHAKVSQYRPEITSQYGFDACGLVAAAAALQPGNWVPLVGTIRAASGDAYGPRTGIQPSPYVVALRRVFSDTQVLEENQWSLCALYEAIQGQAIVIVDIQVGSSENRLAEVPTARSPNFSHFARVLALDVGAGKVFVENTLRGSLSYWELSLRGFWDVWIYPETAVSIRAPFPEEVTRWAVLIE